MVNTTNKNIAGMAVAMLVKVVGSVKTETINISDIKNGLTTRLKNYINGVANAEGLTVGNYIQLSRLADQRKLFATQLNTTQFKASWLIALIAAFYR